MINVFDIKDCLFWHENVGSHPPKMVTIFFTNVRIQKFHNSKSLLVASRYTVDDSHRTTEIIQAITSIEENIEDSKDMEIWDQTMYL